jgi:signal transduction histidine kinase
LKSPHRQDPADLANMWKTLRAKESDWEITEVLNRKDGRQIHVQILASPIFDEAGEVCSAVGLHRDISELVANQQLLRDSKEQMRNLVARLIDIREDERSAIAREVHDELGQMLTRMKMDLHRLRGLVSGSDAEAMADSIVMIVDVMLNSVRAICSRLGPPILKDLGLEEAIDWIGNQFADWCVWDVDIDLKLRSLPRNHDRDFALFRIVQEALTNSARHASASRVWLRGRRDKKSIVLEIEDNGVGISPTAMSRPMSLGLGGMRERAAKIGGKLDTLTMSGGGTTIRVCAPVELADGARREE